MLQTKKNSIHGKEEGIAELVGAYHYDVHGTLVRVIPKESAKVPIIG